MVRHKNRYVVIEIHRPESKETDPLSITSQSLQSAVIHYVQQMHGDFGVGAVTTGFTAKYCNEKTRIAVIRCRHGPHKLITTTLPFIRYIDNKRLIIRILFISATIKKAFYFLKNYQQMRVDEFCADLKTVSERNLMKEAMLNLTPAEQLH